MLAALVVQCGAIALPPLPEAVRSILIPVWRIHRHYLFRLFLVPLCLIFIGLQKHFVLQNAHGTHTTQSIRMWTHSSNTSGTIRCDNYASDIIFVAGTHVRGGQRSKGSALFQGRAALQVHLFPPSVSAHKYVMQETLAEIHVQS